jgi:glutathione synthase
MKLLFITDPLEDFKIYKDSTYAMMQEAQARGWSIAACELHNIQWQATQGVSAHCKTIELIAAQAGFTPKNPWFTIKNEAQIALKDFDAVLMRKDPPFDAEYLYATHLLQQAEREGARVLNSPQALRDHSEKLALMEFAQFAAPTLVARDMQALRDFHAQQHDVIFKPLDGMGGAGIFRVGADGLNLGSVIEQLTRNGTQTIMAQRYLPAIVEGDKRVLLIGGQVVPYALARIPQGGEVRGNLATGGKGVAMKLTTKEREVAEYLAPILYARGLHLVGLDMIGGTLTEINVTSPTCFVEITQQKGLNVAALMMDAVASAVSCIH